MKNCVCTLPKHLHSKPGGFGSKLIGTTRAGIYLRLLIITSLFIFPTLSHVYALQPAATAEVGSLANEPILKTIIIDNYAPYTFVNKAGQPDGFSVDLMRAVAQVMGITLEIKVDTWDNARHALDIGTIDFLPMMAYSTERDKLYDFSPPYTIAYDAFFTRKDSSPISSMDDLPGKKIIVMESDLAHDYLKSLAFIKAEQLILAASLPEALRLLASGNGDTALMPKLVGLALIRDLKLTNLGPSPVVVEAYQRPFSFAVKDGNQAVLERLNQGMSIVKATGQYDEIYKKWFRALEPVGVTNEIFLKYLGGIVLAFLLIGAILLIWSFSLRKQVTARTRSLETEIQERKQAEKALRISEIELKEAQATAHIGSWKWDVKKGEITWSDEMYRIFGINKNTYTGRLGDVITNVIHPDDLYSVLPSNAANIAARPIEYRIILPDTSIRNIWAKTGATVFDQDGKPAFLTGVAQDITERKQAEDEIRRLSRFPAENPNPIMRFSKSGRILYANQSSKPILIDWKRGLGQELPADWCSRIAAVIESGQSQEVEVNCAGRIFSCILAPIIGEDYLNLYGSDITERKQIEADIHRLNAELEQRIEDRTRALKNAQEQLLRQERLSILGQLAGSVGHELRNPLGVISNAVYFLKMSQPDASDKVRQYLDIIEKETRISNKIVTDLLDFTRIKSLSREPVSIPALVSSVLMRYPAPASDPGKNQDTSISVIVDIPNNLPKAFADPRQMEQVLGNLVVNAFQAMQAGGKLTISSAIPSDMIIIEVQDTGTGILPENMANLFEPLFTTKTAGIGLGLAVSKKLAEANGGRIEVTSEVNKGSLFRLILPMHKSDLVPASSPPEISGAGRGDANALPGAANPPEFPTGRDEETK